MPVQIFFCYAHEDELLLNKLKMHLRPLQREGLIDIWHDRDISAGTDWEKEISEHLNSAQIILLLVSPDFMDSDYCYSIEMQRAIERHERREACVIPVILRSVYWQIPSLRKLQALPTDAKPITGPGWRNRDEAFLNVVEGIHTLVKRLTLDPRQEESSSQLHVSPQFTYSGGPLLSAVEVFTIFWGAVWRKKQQNFLAQQLNQFFDFILTSPLIDQLAEYSVPGQPIGYGKRIGTATLTRQSLPSLVSPGAFGQMFQRELSTNPTLPPPTPNILYFIYLPSGVVVTEGDRSWCSYHDHINENMFYVVIPYPDNEGCAGGLAVFDALTLLSAHDLCDAITDPIPGQGWYDDNNGEIGDPCAFKTKKIGAYTVQLEWSNHSCGCT